MKVLDDEENDKIIESIKSHNTDCKVKEMAIKILIKNVTG